MIITVEQMCKSLCSPKCARTAFDAHDTSYDTFLYYKAYVKCYNIFLLSYECTGFNHRYVKELTIEKEKPSSVLIGFYWKNTLVLNLSKT